MAVNASAEKAIRGKGGRVTDRWLPAKEVRLHLCVEDQR